MDGIKSGKLKKSTKIFMFFKRIIRGSTFKRKGIYAIMTPV